MKRHSSSPSDMTSSPSVTSDPLPTSSSPSSLRHGRQLQAECLRGEVTRRTSASSVTCPPSPLSPRDTCGLSPASSFPWPSSSSPSCHNRPARLSLSSPELLAELKDSRTRPLRRVPAQNGLTTIFSGRGRGGQVLSAQPANHTAPS